jgi:HD-GYP domain-containing protein (c-di-GMP phosphodiesterase class II)
VQVFIVLAPIVAGVDISYALAKSLPATTSGSARLLEILLVAATGVIVVKLATNVAQRLLPLSALLRLTLMFPDSTPSRMRVAMRVTSEAKLRELAERTRTDGLPTEPSLAAERILELVAALSYHDHVTRGHAERVRALCGLIAAELGLDEQQQDQLRWSGLLHDIGKLGVPEKILNKPGRLTDREFEIVKTHPAEGERLLQPLRSWLGDAVDAAGQHHERWDGTGYPRGLAGDSIAFSARVVAVADVFDVITSSRSYKEPSTAAKAREEIARCAGTQFDANVVRAFLAVPLTRLRRAIGPLTLLAEIPALAAVPAATSAVSATAGALGAGAVVAAASVVAVPPTAIPPPSTPTSTTVVTVVDAGTARPGPELGFTPERTYRSAGTDAAPSESPGTTLRVNANGKVLPEKAASSPGKAVEDVKGAAPDVTSTKTTGHTTDTHVTPRTSKATPHTTRPTTTTTTTTATASRLVHR